MIPEIQIYFDYIFSFQWELILQHYSKQMEIPNMQKSFFMDGKTKIRVSKMIMLS